MVRTLVREQLASSLTPQCTEANKPKLYQHARSRSRGAGSRRLDVGSFTREAGCSRSSDERRGRQRQPQSNPAAHIIEAKTRPRPHRTPSQPHSSCLYGLLAIGDNDPRQSLGDSRPSKPTVIVAVTVVVGVVWCGWRRSRLFWYGKLG